VFPRTWEWVKTWPSLTTSHVSRVIFGHTSNSEVMGQGIAIRCFRQQMPFILSTCQSKTVGLYLNQSLVGNIPLDWIVPVTMSRRWTTELVEISTFKHFICLFVRSDGSKSGPTFPGIDLWNQPTPAHPSFHDPSPHLSIPIHTLTQLIIQNLPIPSPTIGSCYPIHQPLDVILHHPK